MGSSFIPFIIEHWFLWLLLLIIVLALIANEYQSEVSGMPRLSPQQIVAKMNHDGAVLFDLRTKENYEATSILGAVHVGHIDWSEKSQTTRFNRHKSKPVILIADSNKQAIQLGKQLQTLGFQHLSFLQGGFTAWRAAGLPVEVKGKNG